MLVRTDASGRIEDLTPPPFNARSAVHEYGGGAYALSGDRWWFSNYADGRVYSQAGARTPAPLTAQGSARFGDLTFDPARRRPARGTRNASRRYAARQRAGRGLDRRRLGNGASRRPRLLRRARSEPGRTTPCVARVGPARHALGCGGAVACRARRGRNSPALRPESSAAPGARRSSPPGLRTGLSGVSPTRKAGGTSIAGRAASFVACIGPSTSSGSRCGSSERPRSGSTRTEPSSAPGAPATDGGSAGSLRTARALCTRSPLPWTSIDSLSVQGGTAAFIGGAPDRSTSVVTVDLESGAARVLRSSSALSIGDELLSRPVAVSYPTGDGQRDRARLLLRPAQCVVPAAGRRGARRSSSSATAVRPERPATP